MPTNSDSYLVRQHPLLTVLNLHLMRVEFRSFFKIYRSLLIGFSSKYRFDPQITSVDYDVTALEDWFLQIRAFQSSDSVNFVCYLFGHGDVC